MSIMARRPLLFHVAIAVLAWLVLSAVPALAQNDRRAVRHRPQPDHLRRGRANHRTRSIARDSRRTRGVRQTIVFDFNPDDKPAATAETGRL